MTRAPKAHPGDKVRITAPAAGMPPGSEGIFLGLRANTGEAVVNFWDGGPLRVPEELIESVPTWRRIFGG